MLFAVRHQRGHRYEHQIVFLRELNQLWRAHHMAVFIHNLATDAYRCQARQPAQVRGGFRVPGPHQHPAFPAAQREHMARPPEIHSLGAGFRYLFHGVSPLISRNARRGIHVIDGNGKGRFMIVRIVGNHSAELQLVHDFGIGRHTDEAPGFLCHKIDGLPGTELGRHDQVAFVFPVLVIGYQHHLPCLDGSDGFFNRVECKVFHHLLPFRL